MTPQPATQWRQMNETMSFPALVQYSDATCALWQFNHIGCVSINGASAIRWQPWENPPLPPAPPHREQDAFEMWRETDLLPVGIYSQRECFNAGASHATKAERARFSEGVEKLVQRWNPNPDYLETPFIEHLRALAAGKGETT